MSVYEEIENDILDILTSGAGGLYSAKSFPQNFDNYKPQTNGIECLVTFIGENLNPAGNAKNISELLYNIVVIGKKVKSKTNEITLYNAIETIKTNIKNANIAGKAYKITDVKTAGSLSDGYWIYNISVIAKIIQ